MQNPPRMSRRPGCSALVLLLVFTLAAACTPIRRDPPAHPLRAVVISDLNGTYGSGHYDAEVRHAVRHTVETWRPDLVLVAGDMIAGQAPRLADSVVRDMWQAFDSVVAGPLRDAGIPLVVTLGNHDGSAYLAHARDRRLAVEQLRRTRAGLGGRHVVDDTDYPLRYTVSFGEVFVAVWDATNQESATSPELVGWLEGALTSDEARRARHRVVLGHLPLYAVAEGRNRAGEVLADGDALRRKLEAWGATLFVSGHHHAYYPGRRGALELLHAGALGGGPRPLIGSSTPSPKTATVIDFHRDSVAMTTYTIDAASGTLTPVSTAGLPELLCGITGHVVRRDKADREAACGALPAGRPPAP